MPDNNLPQKVFDLDQKISDARRYVDERIRMHDHNGNDAQRINADDLLGDVVVSVTTDELPKARAYIGSFFTKSPTAVVSNADNAAGPFAFWEDVDGRLESHVAGEAGLRIQASTPGSLTVGEGAGLGTLDIDISASRNPRAYIVLRATSGVTHHRIEFGFTDRTSATDTGSEPTNGIYLRTVEDTNWQAVTRSGGVETASNTGVAVSSSDYQLLEITATSTSVVFKINNSVVATHTTNIPTSTSLGLNVCNCMITSTASGVRIINPTEMHAWWDQYTF